MEKMHKVELVTLDGETLPFACGEEENVLAEAARDGITPFGHLPRRGRGACRAHCSKGAYHLGSHTPAALSMDDVERGEVLLCRTFPRGPLRIRIEQTRAAIEAGPAPEGVATIAALEHVGGEVVRLELQLEPDAQGNGGATFEVGQYAELAPPDRAWFRA